MAFNTGYSFLSTSGIANGGDDLFGDPGSFVTKSTLDTHIADNKVAFVDCNGAQTCMITPLLKVAGTAGSGSTNAVMQVYGVIGFGEPGQTSYEEDGKFFYYLGTTTCATVSSDAVAAASTQTVIETPTGVEFKHYTGGGLALDTAKMDPYILMDVIAASDTAAAGPGECDLTDVNIGFTGFTGIGIFQQLAFSFNIGSANVDSLANAVTCLRY